MNTKKAPLGVFTVPTAQTETIAVQARSEFEALVWAANKTKDFHTVCAHRRFLYHLGAVRSCCGRCYVHCRCEVLRCAS